jgi:ribosomal peptide maturation radical SAM protein 1
MHTTSLERGSTNTHRKRSPSVSEMEALAGALRPGEVLFIVPPFHVLDCPSIAVHLLQACGREAGFHVRVLYANMLLASLIGEEAYAKICDAPVGSFAGERFFARCAFGLPRLGRQAGRMFRADWVIGREKRWAIRPDFDCYRCQEPATLQELQRLETWAKGYVDAVAGAICQQRYGVVGCTTIFEQTAASLALLNRVKNLQPDAVTILGGANCEGEMAQGVASLPSDVDYIFSGESEVTFVEFVRSVLAGSRPAGRLIQGRSCRNLDALPTPSYGEFYEQRKLFLPFSKLTAPQTEIPYETSRGCWWGVKHNCTFCGLNGERMAFRQKSPNRVISDLRSLLHAHPTRRVVMTDNILPHRYFQTLLPQLAGKFPGVRIFYETKANLSLRQVLALKRAGVTSVQPGMESLSTRLLTLMKKGVQARQNLMLLRYARAAGLYLDWMLLWDFPGDDVEAYKETVAMMPLLHHLQPPCAMAHLSVERFSPYYSSPAEFGVRNIKPLAGYYDWTPAGADVERIAYHFTAEYPCGGHDDAEVIQRMWEELARWQAMWRRNGNLPSQELWVFRKRSSYRLVDTRDLWRKKRVCSLSRDEASALVTAVPYSEKGFEAWAVKEKLALTVDGWFVPLPVADPETLLELTEEQHSARYAPSRSNTRRAEPTLVLSDRPCESGQGG